MVGRIGGQMGIEVTDEAVEVLERSLELAGPGSRGIRLRASRGLGGGVEVQVELADGPVAGEQEVEVRGLSLYVDPEITRALPDAVVALEPQHELVVVRPAARTEEPT
jgi:Fe-S cluster assembly iron-binding protein IscA